MNEAPDTPEMKAVAAFLAASFDSKMSGANMREAMIWSLGCPALAAQPGAVGEPTDADWADFGAWAERDKGAMDMLGKLIDVWDDGQLPHEHRCYVDGAWSELIVEARSLLAAAPTEAKPAQDAVDASRQELLDDVAIEAGWRAAIATHSQRGMGGWSAYRAEGFTYARELLAEYRAAISAKKGG